MTIQELSDVVRKQKELNLTRAILVITRKTGPSGHRIRVNGIGYGEIANVQERNGMVETVAWFNVSDLERYISRALTPAQPSEERG